MKECAIASAKSKAGRLTFYAANTAFAVGTALVIASVATDSQAAKNNALAAMGVGSVLAIACMSIGVAKNG